MMVENLDSLLIDVETAFLYGELDEEINMAAPVGLNDVAFNQWRKYLFPIKKGIHGLCQAARQFWKILVQEISKLDFKISPADPCLLY